MPTPGGIRLELIDQGRPLAWDFDAASGRAFLLDGMAALGESIAVCKVAAAALSRAAA